MRSRWAKATVRSPRHSSTITSSLPRRARSTAGSRRSAAKPAPVPIRKASVRSVMSGPPQASVAFRVADLVEEQILDRGRELLDRADLRHELRRLQHLLRLERERIVLVADDRVDVVDAVLGVPGGVEIKLGGGALVPVDDGDRL